MTRIVFLILAYFFLAIAFIGIFIPGLPTVPFLLLAAWFSAKGSERLHKWLYEHPKFGKDLVNWEQQGAISRRSKILAVVMLCASWGFLFFYLTNMWLFAGITCTFIAVSIFVTTRPDPL